MGRLEDLLVLQFLAGFLSRVLDVLCSVLEPVACFADGVVDSLTGALGRPFLFTADQKHGDERWQ